MSYEYFPEDPDTKPVHTIELFKPLDYAALGLDIPAFKPLPVYIETTPNPRLGYAFFQENFGMAIHTPERMLTITTRESVRDMLLSLKKWERAHNKNLKMVRRLRSIYK